MSNEAGSSDIVENDAATCQQIDTELARGRSVSVPGWQPIETAPKDGTVILLCDIDEPVTPFIVVGYFGTDSQKIKSSECWRVKWDQSDLAGGYDPTHWMPLLSPPQETP